MKMRQVGPLENYNYIRNQDVFENINVKDGIDNVKIKAFFLEFTF